MNNVKLFISFFSFLLLISCSKSETVINNDPTLEGSWKLVNVSGGFAGFDDNFQTGEITWSINTSNHTVSVVNNNTNPNKQDILDSGSYNYSLSSDGNCTQNFTIDNMNLGCCSYTSTELIISYEIADGLKLKFIR